MKNLKILSLVGIFFSASSSFAAGVASDKASLATTTLGDDVESAYTLTEIENYSSDEDYSAYYDVITKYLENTDGTAISNEDGSTTVPTVIAVYYGVTIKGTSLTRNTTGGVIIGNFIGQTGSNTGSAVYNTSTDTTIEGDFIANNTTSGYAGSIYNTGIIESIIGCFFENYGSANVTYGGAIYNAGTIKSISGDFIGNYAKSTNRYSSGFGGAIYNGSGAYNTTEDSATITLSGSFYGNYAYSSSSYATKSWGGAIYNIGTVNLETDGADIVFTGNFVYDVASDANFDYTAITNNYVVNFIASKGSDIIVNDSIDAYGDAGKYSGTLNITTDSSSSVEFNNSVEYQTINLNGNLTLGTYSGGDTFDTAIDGYETHTTIESVGSLQSSTINVISGALTIDGAVTLSSHSSATTTTSSSINLHAGSSLIFEKGSSLTFSDGSSLNLVLAETFVISFYFADEELASDYVSQLINGSISCEYDGMDLALIIGGENSIFITGEGLEGYYEVSEAILVDNYYVITVTGAIGAIAVPEPSTYAMIFGVIALGFAYYRRRK